ncbi:MAG: N-acetylmuramoyl-L-alanine amidase, partial [Allopontixanthobacter sp.]|nr:N-acetylmuramoyl-L-alanine amidase [Allopontixanthobacter sp.]
MARRVIIWLLFLVPVLLVGGLYAMGRAIPVSSPAPDYVLRIALPEAGKPVDLPQVYGPDDISRPLLVIDPGHGGRDPG